MAIQYVTVHGGRRLMPPHERDATKLNPKHPADRTVGVEEVVYAAGDDAHLEGLVEAQENTVAIIYTRFWSKPRWRFVVEARAHDGRILAQTKNSIYGERGDVGARFELEDMLRADKLIA
jgi:hypothetical protein